MGMMGGYAAGWGLLGPVLMLAFWIGVIALVAFAVRGFGRAEPTLTAAGVAVDDRALAVLRERYARGEIGREDYEERRRALGADPLWE